MSHTIPSSALIADLAAHGLRVRADGFRAVAGGSINRAFRVETGAGPLMLKVNEAACRDLFLAEAEGLRALALSGAVNVPRVVARGATGNHAWLALQWLDLGPRPSAAQLRLGSALADMHRTVGSAFGWAADNWIGAGRQPNGWNQNWLDFVREARIGHQLELAAGNGLPADLCALGWCVLGRLDRYFDGYRPVPSLLHGDLWGGNWGADRHGRPWLFDPAVHYGDREADIAMTRLFGGFGSDFYRAYERAWPMADGAADRIALYQLYHLLNHFNMFGSAWVTKIAATLRQLTGAHQSRS